MKTIDFLPDSFRQREALRRARAWWALAAVALGGAVGIAVTAQLCVRHSLLRQLAELEPQYAAAQAQARELADLHAQLAAAAHAASLFTYLEHPWPRTQLLAEVVRPLPPSIRLTHIRLADDELARAVTHSAPRRPHGHAEDDAAKQPAAEHDLVRLREEMDFRQTVIELSGQTGDVARLHRYVGDLSGSPLVADARVSKLEAVVGASAGQTQFAVRLVVRPGYGQRGSTAVPVAGVAVPSAMQTRSPAPALAPQRTHWQGGGG